MSFNSFPQPRSRSRIAFSIARWYSYASAHSSVSLFFTLPQETPFLTTAFTSLSSGAKPSPSSSSAASAAGLDLSRYKLDPPAGEDPVEWRKAIENAQAQLEHQTNRAVNLELLKKFGATKWKIHNEQVAQLKTKLAAELEEAKSRVEQINRKRKTEQVAAGQELSQLEHGYYDLVYKNHQIETANWQLEKKLRGETTAKEQ